MFRLLFAFLLAFCLSLPAVDASAEASPSSAETEVSDEKAPPATFGDSSYPLRFARRPLVLDEGMVRADGRVTVGGVIGSGTFSSLDIGGAVSPIENLELGLSTELTGAIPAAGGISLISVIFSPRASYGDIPIYARYQFVDRDQAMIAVDLTLVLPTNTDFSMTASLPLRIVELFDLFTMDMNASITYRNGDKYAALSPNPSKNTADFAFSGGSVINITDKGFIEIGGGLRIANVGGGTDVKTVIELPAYLGGGYTLEKKVLVDLFAQFGWDPLMTANTPPGRDTFNVKDDWYLTIGATVHTRALFGKNAK
jgi:hypothetical protein